MAVNKPQNTKEEIHAAIGDLSKVEVMHNQILIGIWMRSEKVGAIYLPDATRDEDRWQGKVGLVLKKGPLAFKGDGSTDFAGQDVHEDDWLIYRVSDGFAIDINGTHCRLLEDIHIKGRVSDPSVIY